MLALCGEGRARSSRFRVLDTASRISSASSTIGVHSPQHPHGRVELPCSSRGGPGLMSVGTTPTSYLVSYRATRAPDTGEVSPPPTRTRGTLVG